MSSRREPRRLPLEPGQESVWDYPRPPRLEPSSRHIEVWFNGDKIADSHRAWRVLETSHPPAYYIPPDDVLGTVLRATDRTSFCEWKGMATYFDIASGERIASHAAWSYPNPSPAFSALANHVSFYAGSMDECRVNGIVVCPQPGDFYGGWITPEVVGPFKGEPGTQGW